MITRDLKLLGNFTLSGNYKESGLLVDNIYVTIASINGDYDVVTNPAENTITVSNIRVTAILMYHFTRKLYFLGIPIPLWIWGDEGFGSGQISALLTLTKQYSVNKETGKPYINPSITVASTK